MNGHFIVRNLALPIQRKCWPTSLGGPINKSAFVFPGWPLRPHLIIYTNKVTQGEPLEPDVSQISMEGQGVESEFIPCVKDRSIMPSNKASIRI